MMDLKKLGAVLIAAGVLASTSTGCSNQSLENRMERREDRVSNRQERMNIRSDSWDRRWNTMSENADRRAENRWDRWMN